MQRDTLEHLGPMEKKQDPLYTAYKIAQYGKDKYISVVAFDSRTDQEEEFKYKTIKNIAVGTFGAVALITQKGTAKTFALKIVHQSRRHRNRELSIWKKLIHTNITSLIKYFYITVSSGEEFLGLISEYIPSSLDKIIGSPRLKAFPHLSEPLSFQLFLALTYMHKQKICHRDIKPHNILVDLERGVLKICDFGCAKQLSPEKPNISYMCARYYRAPEALFGSEFYTCKFDIWAAGCILAEIVIGTPLFPGRNTKDQISQIASLIGSPETKDFIAMGCSPQKVTQKKTKDLRTLLEHRISPEGFDLIERILIYNPDARPSAYKILCHPFFRKTRQLCKEHNRSAGDITNLFRDSPETLDLYKKT